ncbi:MAG: hypothetical protein LBL39_05570 [Planctomycetaceae bacterium]|nr:hypothetical protein [Planctomycetaceae bacterium]
MFTYFFINLDSLQSDDSIGIDGFGGFDFSCVVLITLVGVAWIIIMIHESVLRNSEDEMFILTPMTPRQQLHAYMFETFVLTSFYTSLFAPVILMIFWHSPNFPILVVIMTCGNTLIGQTVILVFLSFIPGVKIKSQIRLFSGYGVMFFIIAMLYASFGMAFAAGQVLFIDSPRLFLIVPTIYISFLIGSLLIIATAYSLSEYAFKTRNKSIVARFGFNIFCYISLSAVIYFICLFVAGVMLGTP